jgi:hypothetical protein
MRQGTLIQERINTGIWHNKWVRIGLQVLLIVAFSALAATAKKIHPSMGIPGSSAPFWLAAMVVARSTMRWDGAGLLTGVGIAAWGIPIGLENSFMHNLGLYALSGALLDIVTRIPHLDIRRPLGAVLCGAIAHMAKFGFIMVTAMSATITKHFEIVGILNAFGLHIAFGITAGIVGWTVFRGGQFSFRRIFRSQN